MDNFENLQVTTHQIDGGGPVVEIALNRPKVNALSTALLEELLVAAEACSADPPGAVVITGAGRFFAAGAEISEFTDPATREPLLKAFRDAFDAVAGIPCPTIAAVNGLALGGGAELAWCCDYRIAGESTVFGQPEILLGIIPGAGGTQRLARLIGAARAKEIVFEGEQLTAEDAQNAGLVNVVVPDEEILSTAIARAEKLAKGPLLALRAAKTAIDTGIDGALSDGLDLEGEMFDDLFNTNDAATGIATFFEHGPGKATFTGT